MGLKGKIFKFMSDILKDGSNYKLYTQEKNLPQPVACQRDFFLQYSVGVSNTIKIMKLRRLDSVLGGSRKQRKERGAVSGTLNYVLFFYVFSLGKLRALVRTCIAFSFLWEPSTLQRHSTHLCPIALCCMIFSHFSVKSMEKVKASIGRRCKKVKVAGNL